MAIARAAAVVAAADGGGGADAPLRKPRLYDIPVSNNGARIRMQLYARGWEDRVEIVSPMELGGLKSPEYLALNPLGKMPMLVLPDGSPVIESEIIQQYLATALGNDEPTLVPQNCDPLTKARMDTIIRLHDVYFCSDQAAMYRAMDVNVRSEKIATIANLIGVLEGLMSKDGPYMMGPELSFADLAWFPSFVFMTFMLPKFFGWRDVFAGKPRLATWWEAAGSHPAGKKVFGEVHGGLTKWEESGRWEKVGIIEQLKSTDLQFAH